ncbi:hypothetical protein PRK78_005798 [Emydomyces testavorans]|uniref:Uncharacterized protein n=1 Tax=Emydomyces testavorans TaxID=2070801 RepID=A0AAF0IKC8_9EURO|nr:hypothetical protein PRK78_005798 [Emydomyces testavorans]
MAPKGGRGGGRGGSGRSSSSSSCSSDAFSSDFERTLIAFVALWLLVDLVLASIVNRRKKRILSLGYPKESLQWAVISLCITFTIVALLLSIIGTVLIECGTGTDTGAHLVIAASWLFALGILLLYGLILIPVCRQLHQVAGQVMAKIVTFAHFGLMVFISIILLAFLAVYTAATEAALSSSLRLDILSLLDAQRGLLITYDVFALIGMIIAAVTIGIAVSRSSGLRSGSIAVWIPLLVAASLGLAAFQLGTDVNSLFGRNINRSLRSRALATLFIGQFFFSATFLCVLFVVSNPALAVSNQGTSDPARPVDNAPAPPPAPVPVPGASAAPNNSEMKDYYAPSPVHPPNGQQQYMQQPQYQGPPMAQQQQPPTTQQQQHYQQYPAPPPPQSYY